MHTEVELKLRLAPENLPRLARHALVKTLSRGRPLTQKLYSVYYDTPDLELKKRNLTLRLRRMGSRWVQTVKGGGGAAAGLHRRGEWETQVAGQNLDFSKLSEPGLTGFLTKLRKRLAPVFVTEFSRSSRLLGLDGGGLVELCLDRGEIKAGSAVSPISEIELELQSGNVARLYELALELQKSIPLRLENISKAERGYQLFTGKPAPVRKALRAELVATMTVNDGFKSIVWGCLEHLQANEQGVAQGLDCEYLHQMRVALRRARSAFGVFSTVFPKTEFAFWLGELKWLASAIGPARDWDVFTLETLPAICASFPQHAGLRELQRQSEKLRRKKNAAARRSAKSRRYQQLILKLGAWLTAGPWMAQVDEATLNAMSAPLTGFAAQALEQRHGQLRKRSRHLLKLSAEELHALRIAAKKLRYAGEFFAPLFPGGHTGDFLKAVAALQEALGKLNDAATAQRLLKDLAANGPECGEASGMVIGWTACSASRGMDDLERAWMRFKKEKPFWV